jgi:hypothetical protein
VVRHGAHGIVLYHFLLIQRRNWCEQFENKSHPYLRGAQLYNWMGHLILCRCLSVSALIQSGGWNAEEFQPALHICKKWWFNDSRLRCPGILSKIPNHYCPPAQTWILNRVVVLNTWNCPASEETISFGVYSFCLLENLKKCWASLTSLEIIYRRVLAGAWTRILENKEMMFSFSLMGCLFWIILK